MDLFISHSSKNRAIAAKIETGLSAAGLDVWLDDSDIHLGALLREELQASIGRCRVLLLLWSKPAAQSRWINAEWLTAFHLDKFILPCTLDDAPLPQCLQPSVFLPVTRATSAYIERLARAVREAPASRNHTPPPMRSESPDLERAIAEIARDQHTLGTLLEKRQPAKAATLQTRLDDVMAHATATWPLDPVIVNLDGYHLKNAYMVKYWDAIQAGRAPGDPLLGQAERRFFETLSIDPTDPSALNGLGSVLILERELTAAQFFVEAAIKAAKAQGMTSYPAAEQDLELIRYYKRAAVPETPNHNKD